MLRSAALESAANVEELAQYVIDHEALGRPAVRMGDINGDGFGELIFARSDANATTITMIRGVDNAGVPVQWPRVWDATLPLNSANHYTLSVSNASLDDPELSVIALHYAGNSSPVGLPHDDLLVISPSITGGRHGFVFSGDRITRNASPTTPIMTLLPDLADPMLGVGRVRQDDLRFAVAGDINGNGRDDIVLYDTLRRKASVLLGGTSGNARVGSQTIVAGNLAGELVQPVAVGDLNGDGLAEIAFASATDVRVFSGTASPGSITFATPDMTFNAPAGHPGSSPLSVTGGDFSGDGHGDLAIDLGAVRMATGSGDEQTYVFFAPSAGTHDLADADVQITAEPGGLNIGRALTFDGNTSISVNHGSSIDIRREITIEAWIRLDSDAFDDPSVNWRVIAQKGEGPDSASRTYAMWVRDDGSLRLDTAGVSSGGQLVVSTPGIVELDQWQHVAGVIDRNTGKMSLYVNGRLATIASGTDGVGVENTRSFLEPLQLGGAPNDTESGVAPFKGDIEEIRIWSTARTPAQISANMNRRLVGNEPNLAAYYRFEETIGSMVLDRTANGNHGLLPGGGEFVDVYAKLGQLPAIPNVDLNADGIDDLVVGALAAPDPSGATSGPGRIYVVHGSGRTLLPAAGQEVLELANRTVPGSGSFIELRADGQTELLPAPGRCLPVGRESDRTVVPVPHARRWTGRKRDSPGRRSPGFDGTPRPAGTGPRVRIDGRQRPDHAGTHQQPDRVRRRRVRAGLAARPRSGSSRSCGGHAAARDEGWPARHADRVRRPAGSRFSDRPQRRDILRGRLRSAEPRLDHLRDRSHDRHSRSTRSSEVAGDLQPGPG